MHFKLAIFDWDGILVDSRENAYRGAKAIFESYGITAPPYAEYLGETRSDYVQLYRKYGVPETVTRDDLNVVWKAVFNNSPCPPLREGAREMFRQVKDAGFTTAIVSGAVPELLNSQATELKVLDLLDYVCADACGKQKELLHVLERFACKPREAFYMDDTKEGLAAAKEVGVYAVGIDGGFHSRTKMLSADPDVIVAAPLDLIPLLRGALK